MTFHDDHITWVLSDEDYNHFLATLSETSECVLDLETTGLDEFAETGDHRNGGVAARIVCASFTIPTQHGEPTTWLLPLSHPESMWQGRWRKMLTEVCATLKQCDVALIGHNVKFDLRWLYHHTKIDLSAQLAWDTRLSSALLDENKSTKLKERAPATFGIPRWDDFDLTYPGAAEEVPLFDLGAYAARDTYWTWRLVDEHRRAMNLIDPEPDLAFSEDVENARLGKLATWCVMPAAATLTAVEQRGIVMDTYWVKTELASHEERAAELADRLAHKYPDAVDPENPSFAPTSHWFRDWTTVAVERGDLRVAELTPTGKPRWSKEVLVRQSRDGSELAVELLALRSHLKKAEFLRSWTHEVTTAGTIHTQYNMGTVVTGRLSSSSPNMQQVTAALRPAFIASPGHLLADLDYSQIELRVAAFVSRCEPMLEAFRRGDDLHTLLAARITGKTPQAVTKAERQSGKSANFGLLYGMGAVGFRMYAEAVYDVSFTADEAQGIYNAFFETWQGMGDWHAAQVAKAHRTGQVVSPIGRVRRLPDLQDANEDRVRGAERAAINAPIQGFASDLMQIASASIEGNVPGVQAVKGARIVATIHDSIVVEVPEDHWQEVVNECLNRMTRVGDIVDKMGCHLDVPLEVSARVSRRWGGPTV